ncbi:MAG: hypothetical protein IKC31_05070 [Clostridia bacterium]|nr:hypothetical protein [Clostridia bacterium]
MGKGNRNRNANVTQRTHVQQKKKAPTWLMPVITIALVVVIIGFAIVDSILGSGIVERNRVIVESNSGKFDITQQMATYLAWQDLYTTYYYSYDYYKESLGNSYANATEFALSMSASTIKTNLRDCIEDVKEDLVDYVAVCDAARQNNISLTEANKKSIDDVIDSLKSSQTSFGYPTFSSFLNYFIGNGIKEKDVRKALEIITLHNEYCTMKKIDFEKVITLADLDTQRLEFPEKYYFFDHLNFTTENKELAEKLAACKTAEEFRNVILQNHFDTEYEEIFTTLVASKDYLTVEGKVDSESGKALTEALDALGFEAEKGYSKKDMTSEQKKLSDWLFNTNRKQYQTAIIAGENAHYIVAFMSPNASTEHVFARVKEYKYEGAGVSYGEDETFMNDLFETFAAKQKADLIYAEMNKSEADIPALLEKYHFTEKLGVTESSEDVPKAVIHQALKMFEKTGALLTANEKGVQYVIYLDKVENNTADIHYLAIGKEVSKYSSASEQSDALVDALSQTGANMKQIMTDRGALTRENVTSSTAASVVPAAVIKEVFKTGVAAGNIYTANANGSYYVIYVDSQSEDKKTATISYVTLEGDLYYQIYTALNASYGEDGAAATEKTDAYTPDAEKDSYLAWLSEVKEGTLESVRKEFDTKMIEKTETDSKTNQTVTKYTVYMLINTPMYLEMHTVVNGGYVLISDAGHAETAAQIVAQLQGKTGVELERALSAAKSTATISTFSEGSVIDDNLKAWLFSTDRKDDEAAAITNKNGNGTYVAIYLERLLSWQAAAKDDLVDKKVEDWVADLVKTGGYAANEKALDKIGETSTTATTAATTVATTAEAAADTKASSVA